MMMQSPRKNFFLLLAGLLLFLCLNAAAQPEETGPAVELSPLVTRVLEDDLLTDEQRRAVMIFHGQWGELGDLTPQEQLALLVARFDVQPDPDSVGRRTDLAVGGAGRAPTDVDFYLLAEAALRAGDPTTTINTDIEAGPGIGMTALALLTAQAHEDLGQYPQAMQQLAGIREKAQEDITQFESAEELTAAAEAVVMLARLEGRPSADFHLANQMLSRAHEVLDPLYWPAYVAEAKLLFSKGNPREAMDAVTQALSLNPKSSEAWYLLGSMVTRFFNFDGANHAIDELRAINPEHPLADALAVQVALRQKDAATAREVIAPALERYPTHRKLLALNAAVQAMSYDDDATAEALAEFARLAPGNPLAVNEVGMVLNDARQYAQAEPYLRRATAMMPGWSEPQLALGELYMQWGRLELAAAQLQAAASLDPFHKEITNQLTLVQEMLGYATIETDRYIVRYVPGIDEVLARDVASHLDEMISDFGQRFDHVPPDRVQVDLMPDDQHFAVRVTGMPSIWTIAACTGEVIAMTPPRPGPKRAYGTYNWLNVMGHEYTHVVNLSQTNNRVPHWFTEGCAVNQETTGRQWQQHALLAECYNNDKLFAFDDINWGFIRPTEPYHRSLAYAQSAWIMQYIEEEHGWDNALALLDQFKQGVGERQAVRTVFGVEPEDFMDLFHDWAGGQVAAWGMSGFGVEPTDETLKELLSIEEVSAIDQAVLDQALMDHPDEPALLKIIAERALAGADKQAAIDALKRYQRARPVDPWADREMARLALVTGDAQTAIAALRRLDTIDGDAPEYATELARVFRGRKAYADALTYAERALLREPYNATLRESAATIAVQAGDLERAVFHVESLAILEPDRSIHYKRLAALYDRLGSADRAAAARRSAEELELSENR